MLMAHCSLLIQCSLLCPSVGPDGCLGTHQGLPVSHMHWVKVSDIQLEPTFKAPKVDWQKQCSLQSDSLMASKVCSLMKFKHFWWLIGLRIAHLRIAHHVANPEVDNPEGIHIFSYASSSTLHPRQSLGLAKLRGLQACSRVSQDFYDISKTQKGTWGVVWLTEWVECSVLKSIYGRFLHIVNLIGIIW